MIHHKFEKDITDYHNPRILKWVDMNDETDHHHLHHDRVMSLDLNLEPIFQRSRIIQVSVVNGLIILWES